AELEGSYDVLRLWSANASDQHLTIFANASLLNARFTSSALANQAGKTPAYAPGYVVKAGATLRRDAHYKISLVVDSVGSNSFRIATSRSPRHPLVFLPTPSRTSPVNTPS